MKTKHVESLEEMVFRNKNKLYGAYSLRRKYNKYLTFSLILAFFLMISGLAYPVIASLMNKHTGIITDNKGIYEFGLPSPPTDLPPPPPPPVDLVKSTRFSPPTVVMDSVESDFGKQALLADIKPIPPPDIEPDATPVDNKAEPTVPTPEKQVPRLWVEEMPMFPGGDAALLDFLRKNLKYHEEAKDIGTAGRVFISFVVEINGVITDVTIMRGIGNGCDEEAVRVVKSMPNWTPGKQNNIPVRVKFSLPVKFTLH
jgi:protein TonB